MMINDITIDSRVTKNIDYKATKDGVPMAIFDVANNRGKHTNYFKVMCFNGCADYAHKYLHKAQKVAINGNMRHDIEKDGKNYKDYYEIIAKHLDPNRDDGSKFKVTTNTTPNVPKDLVKDVNKASKKHNKKAVSKEH